MTQDELMNLCKENAEYCKKLADEGFSPEYNLGRANAYNDVYETLKLCTVEQELEGGYDPRLGRS